MVNMFTVFALVAFFSIETSATGCWGIREEQFVALVDHALIGHSFLNSTGVSQFMCSVLCLRHSSCLSFNHGDTDGICQLNDAKRDEFPASFKQVDNFSYFASSDGITNKPCKVCWIYCLEPNSNYC